MCCIVKCCNCHILLAVDMAGVACQGLVCVCVCVCVRLEKWQTSLYGVLPYSIIVEATEAK